MTTILITGSGGFLGYTLCRDLAAIHEVMAGCHANFVSVPACTPIALDITDAVQVETLFRRFRPEVVIHAAAMSQPDACEQDPRKAQSVIVDGTRNVARQSQAFNCRLFHISTDLVFDGEKGNYTEEDAVRGINVYSRCKIEAERIVLSLDPGAFILRISILYGAGSPFNPGFIGTMLTAWRSGRPMTFYTDQFRTPTFAPQVSRVVQTLLERPDLRGVFHVGGAERLSRYEFACIVAKYAGAPPELVRPGSMRDVPAAALRGADCSLVSEKLRSAAGVEPLGCTAALDSLAQAGFFAR